ncbi:MAG: VOC family protein [Planctomycetota bacterium]|nr:VOC family protein [Planctomycetota bacterium]
MSEQPKPAFGPGSFMWWECWTRDLKKAKEFYAKVVGWSYEEVDMGPGGIYTLLKVGDKKVGGMAQMDGPEWGELPSHWAYYIDVEDVDSAHQRVRELGGKALHDIIDAPGIGRFFPAQDPAGAHLYLMQPEKRAAEPPCADAGSFLWVELMSRDFAKAEKFYSELLGWNGVKMPMPGGEYTLFQVRGANAGGGMPMPAEVPAEAPSCWVGYIHVPNVDKAAETAQQLGAQLLVPVMDIPNVGRFTQIMDPTGAVVALMTPAPM